MSSVWNRIAEASEGTVTVEDLEKAATRLDTYQVIHEKDHGSRHAYELVVRYLSAFRNVFEPFGRQLLHRPHHGYVVLMARHRVGPRMRLFDTRMAVILRRLYDDKMQRADIENGEIVCEVVEIQQAWQEHLNIEWRFKQSEVEDSLRTLRRHGIVQQRPTGDPSNPFVVVVRPAIEDVIGEVALHQLAAYGHIGSDTEDDDEVA